MPPTPTVTGRLAPSPTGELHLGHARSFVLAWASARAQGGRVVLRWEDIGSERVRAEFLDGNRRDLEWLGLDWDVEVVQTQRLAPIRAALDQLVAAGAVYPCICSRREVREAQLDAPHEAPPRAPHTPAPGSPLSDLPFTTPEAAYPGTCRGRFTSLADAFRALAAEGASDRLPNLRFDVSTTPPHTVHDLVHAAVAIDLAQHGGDFVVGRAAPNGQHEVGYQIAVVVDDATDGVTEVLRGDDLLPSAARQELIATALGLPSPRWIHVPLVVDANGERLAKRHAALGLATLRERGVSARDVLAWIASSCGLEGAPQPPAELARAFDLARLPRTPVVAPAFA